jgi:hypothetical protein
MVRLCEIVLGLTCERTCRFVSVDAYSDGSVYVSGVPSHVVSAGV